MMVAVGPLRSPEAIDLVVCPMDALGYRFQHDELPARILAFCNNNPGLIVLFMQALIARLLDRHRLSRSNRPPVIVTDEDIQATASKESLAELIRERFDLTLELDPAYKVIAYTIAHEAIERGPSVALSARELRGLASSWWPAGLSGMTNDGFRSLCEELVDLGVLARRSGKFGLRSPNILRFLGTAEHVEEVLLEAESRLPVEKFSASAALPRLGGPNERSPLTAEQLADVIAPRNQVRLVVTSNANRGDRISSAITTFARARISFETVDPASARLSQYRNTTGRHRVLFCDLREVADERAAQLVEDAMNRRVDRQGTVGIVFVAWPDNIGLLRRVLSEESEPWSRLAVVRSGSVTAPAWRHWVDEAELKIADPNYVHLRTGGWMPWLEVAAASQDSRQLADALDTLTSDRDAAVSLVNDSGIGSGELRALFSTFLELGDVPEDDAPAAAVMAIEDPSGGAALVEMLKLLGALTTGADRVIRPDPVLAETFRLAASRDS